MPTLDPLQYPIGPVRLQDTLSESARHDLITQIQSTPTLLRRAVAGLSEEQVNTVYRPNGWTIRQVVHHLPDSHLNAYIRFRWALTEESPTIKAYDQDRWAQLPDACEGPIEESLLLLDALHTRWCRLMKAMTLSDWQRKVVHPEDGERTCQDFLIIYAWHGLHHVAHITNLRIRQQWDE